MGFNATWPGLDDPDAPLLQIAGAPPYSSTSSLSLLPHSLFQLSSFIPQHLQPLDIWLFVTLYTIVFCEFVYLAAGLWFAIVFFPRSRYSFLAIPVFLVIGLFSGFVMGSPAGLFHLKFHC